VTPLRQVLTFKLGIEIAAARETVSAVSLDRRAARELGCRPGIAAFRSDRVSVGPDGTPIVYDRVFIPGDRFRITRNLKYDTTTATSTDASASPITPDPMATSPRATDPRTTGFIASREAVRMSAKGAKKPSRQTEILHVQPL
ncbi:MAG TPA: UTRA domain-containing protein, partial [Candidatus Dormibacteraeota bacterium]|nr:UTRA domain-containing protein [Candidatus Dormibacteraeota bacterium]